LISPWRSLAAGAATRRGAPIRCSGECLPLPPPAEQAHQAEAGFPGTELEIWQGIVAPAGTPPAIVRKLNEEFVKAAKSPDIVAKVAAQAVEMYTTTPQELGKLIANDIDRLGKVIRDAGIKVQ
jgi:hypothetical protein